MRRLRLAALGAAAALAACGFHLQGVTRLPQAFATTQVVAEDRYTDFHRALGDALRASGSRIAGSGATATIEVLTDDSGQRVLSVSASNTPTEYEVYYTIRYRVRIGDKEVLSPKVLTLTRDYSFDVTAVLAKEQEQDQIRAALARELAALVMRRLSALGP
ncbi:MAG TPA: LPS assembly lipoprotein LptE [Steroidobacteraceae bacterium]|nr:LPS assembly lipoprotein LptE [Steroidobacteraceae bacterium]